MTIHNHDKDFNDPLLPRGNRSTSIADSLAKFLSKQNVIFIHRGPNLSTPVIEKTNEHLNNLGINSSIIQFGYNEHNDRDIVDQKIRTILEEVENDGEVQIISDTYFNDGGEITEFLTEQLETYNLEIEGKSKHKYSSSSRVFCSKILDSFSDGIYCTGKDEVLSPPESINVSEIDSIVSKTALDFLINLINLPNNQIKRVVIFSQHFYDHEVLFSSKISDFLPVSAENHNPDPLTYHRHYKRIISLRAEQLAENLRIRKPDLDIHVSHVCYPFEACYFDEDFTEKLKNELPLMPNFEKKFLEQLEGLSSSTPPPMNSRTIASPLNENIDEYILRLLTSNGTYKEDEIICINDRHLFNHIFSLKYLPFYNHINLPISDYFLKCLKNFMANENDNTNNVLFSNWLNAYKEVVPNSELNSILDLNSYIDYEAYESIESIFHQLDLNLFYDFAYSVFIHEHECPITKNNLIALQNVSIKPSSSSDPNLKYDEIDVSQYQLNINGEEIKCHFDITDQKLKFELPDTISKSDLNDYFTNFYAETKLQIESFIRKIELDKRFSEKHAEFLYNYLTKKLINILNSSVMNFSFIDSQNNYISACWDRGNISLH